MLLWNVVQNCILDMEIEFLSLNFDINTLSIIQIRIKDAAAALLRFISICWLLDVIVKVKNI